MGSWELVELSRRKGEDTPAKKRRRLPYVAVIERSDPFRSDDQKLLEEQCFRITNGQEFYHGRRWERSLDRDVHVVHFAAQHQAEALDRWVRNERFYDRPRPKYGPSEEEARAFEQAAIKWGLQTGALRRVVQAYRRAMFDQASMLRCRTAAQQELRRYLPPDHGSFDMAQVMVSWAMREHWRWFNRERIWANNPYRPPDWYPPDDAYAHNEE